LGISGIDKAIKNMTADKAMCIKESQIYGEITDDYDELIRALEKIKSEVLSKKKEKQDSDDKILSMSDKKKKAEELLAQEEEKILNIKSININLENLKNTRTDKHRDLEEISEQLDAIKSIEKEVNGTDVEELLKEHKGSKDKIFLIEEVRKKYSNVDAVMEGYKKYLEISKEIESAVPSKISELQSMLIEADRNIGEKDRLKKEAEIDRSKLLENIGNIESGKCPSCETEFFGDKLESKKAEFIKRLNEKGEIIECSDEKLKELIKQREDIKLKIKSENLAEKNLNDLNIKRNIYIDSIKRIEEMYLVEFSAADPLNEGEKLEKITSRINQLLSISENIEKDLKGLNEMEKKLHIKINEYNSKKDKIGSLEFLREKKNRIITEVSEIDEDIRKNLELISKVSVNKKYEDYKALLEKVGVDLLAESEKNRQTSIAVGIMLSEGKALKDKTEKVKENKEKRSVIDKKIEITNKTIKSMHLFKTELMSRVRPKLSEISSDILDRLSSNRYNSIKFDEDYNIFVGSGEADEEIDFYSDGEIDLINIAIRLAISKIISSDINIIALDEIFKFQDSIRKQDIMDSISSLSGTVFDQIFIITHDEFIKQSCDNLIEVRENNNTKNRVYKSY
jgi:exonuclease SbcC